MSLREEIARILHNGYFEEPFIATSVIADRAINKVLDAAIQKVLNVGLSADDGLATVNAINKLRG